MTRTIEPTCLVDAGASLGESPVWDGASGRLAVGGHQPRRGARPRRRVGRGPCDRASGPTVGAVALSARRRLVLARNHGFSLLADDGTVTELVDVEADKDGQPDERRQVRPGRAVLGRQHRDRQERRPNGALYRLDADLGTTVMRRGVTVSNGLGWSPDATTMYYIDSLDGGVDAYAFDVATGELGERRRFVDVAFEHGEPDGLTVDATGCVWFAIWRAGEVRRYTPDGRLDTIVRVPASLSTSCCFGGADLDTLFITSASCDLTPEQRAAEPHAGALFACRPASTACRRRRSPVRPDPSPAGLGTRWRLRGAAG